MLVMHKFRLLALPILLLALASCGDKAEKGVIELQFKALYDGQPLVMLQQYDYNDTLDILFQRFNFYLSNVELHVQGKPLSSFKNVLEIDFVDFDETDDIVKAQEGDVIRIEDVAAGVYDQVRFGLGVPPDLNATEESDYPDSHPLGKDSHYWSAWGSYIFTMINGKVDVDGDGQFDDSSVLYHTGSDEVYREKSFSQQIEVKEGQTTRLVFEVDLHKLFLDADGVHYIDIIANPNTHDIDDKEIANQVMDNFQETLWAGQ